MKRTLSLLLTVLLVLGLALPSFAASGSITDILLPINTNNDPSTDSVQAGTVWTYPLTANMFSWSSGTGAANEPVTTAQLKSAGITVKYSSSDMSAIKAISLGTQTSAAAGGQKTAVVTVEFVDNLVGTTGKDFKVNLFLAQKNSRKEASRIVLEGTLENTERTIPANTDYVNIEKGEVIKPSGACRNCEVYIGAGVTIRTNLYADRKYYGVAEEKITSADDAVLRKFPSIDTIIVLNTVNLNGSGNIVSLDYKSAYVYDASGKYLGTTSSALPYSNKYYLSSKQIDMTGQGTGTTTGSSSSSSSSSSTASSGSSTGSASTSGTLTAANAKTQMTTAVNTAKANGSGTATVSVRNVGSVSADALKTMAQTASASNLKGRLQANTTSGNSVVGRVTINPALASNLTSDTQLGVFVDSGRTSATKNKFSKNFKNKMAVVSLAQPSSYGMKVTIAAKADLSGMNKQNLYFYSYNKSTNKYTRLTETGYTTDANYVYFTTTLAGDIIISDGALAK